MFFKQSDIKLSSVFTAGVTAQDDATTAPVVPNQTEAPGKKQSTALPFFYR